MPGCCREVRLDNLAQDAYSLCFLRLPHSVAIALLFASDSRTHDVVGTWAVGLPFMRCANDQGQQLPITSGTGHKPATLVALLNVQVFRVTEANFVSERLGHPMALPDVREIALIPDQARHDDVGHTAIVNHSLRKSR